MDSQQAYFSQEKLEMIFKVDSNSPDRVISRESTWLEFKESFGWGSITKYAKSMAAFANVKGGYIVYGVKNSPHLLIGLKDRRLQDFENIDPERLANSLNEIFAPEINWDMMLYEFQGKKYGIIYIGECSNKPVMCIKGKDDILHESAIYYRYRGRTQRIKYPELRTIIEESRKAEQKLWMKHLLTMARIGVKDIGIFNFKTGITSVGNGASFMIDEAILSQLSFIKEGEFSEVKGAPTLKVIGSLQGIPPIASKKPYIVHERGIRLQEIVIDFINCAKISNPLDYLTQICLEVTANLPIYYYIFLSQKDNSELLEVIGAITSRQPGKKALCNRLKNHPTHHKKYAQSGSKAASERKRFLDAIEKETKIEFSTQKDVIRYCEAIIHQSPEVIRSKEKFFRGILKEIFINYYEKMNSAYSPYIRSALCWLDEALYKDKCKHE
jgi:uncharacterized ATP-binding protein UU034